ncbi:MAG TPA: hypothetical protein PLF70_01285 [Candidatus Portnoybacteria bacterium]|jgi:predicted transcriptional regulator|nr:hypothetical protein [Candidatus Portnoybacteria bacterium]MDD5752124.1 hypothetical protein [Candidatus Portnoybacteria bacterium]HNU97002.1 hypothetical protein [Candidatus Portnoybacteria bacterium]HPJ80321.1 hypothetical protein [Candidatus Portnoybacteria bacterium]
MKKRIKKIKRNKGEKKRVKKTAKKIKISRKSKKVLRHKSRRSLKTKSGPRHRRSSGKIKRIKKYKAKISKFKNVIGRGALEQLFESLVKVKLMKFFFRNPIDIFSTREILKMARANKSAVKQEIKKLEKIGLIDSKKRQGRIVYFLNPNFDFLEELKNLILKSTVSSKSKLVNDIRKTGNIKLLILGGIFRNSETDGADILIVGDKINPRKLTTFLKDLEAEVGRELNCASMSAKEFNYRYDMYDRFVRDLINENKDILINKLNLW